MFTGVIGLIGVAVAPAAAAHDDLLDSVPRAEAVLAEAPPTVELEFAGELVSASVALTDGCGRPVGATTTTEGRTVRAEVAVADVPDARGGWTVGYVTIGGDGHEVEGSLTFAVEGTPDCSAARPSTAETSPTTDATAVAVPSEPATSGSTADAGATLSAGAGVDEPSVPMVPLLAGGVVLLAGTGAVIASRLRDRRPDGPGA